MTKTKVVQGAAFDGNVLRPAKLMLRYSADTTSSTLSISDERQLMLQVDYQDIRALLTQQEENT